MPILHFDAVHFDAVPKPLSVKLDLVPLLATQVDLKDTRPPTVITSLSHHRKFYCENIMIFNKDGALTQSIIVTCVKVSYHSMLAYLL